MDPIHINKICVTDVLQELRKLPCTDGADQICYIANRLNNFFIIVQITPLELREVSRCIQVFVITSMTYLFALLHLIYGKE